MHRTKVVVKSFVNFFIKALKLPLQTSASHKELDHRLSLFIVRLFEIKNARHFPGISIGSPSRIFYLFSILISLCFPFIH